MFVLLCLGLVCSCLVCFVFLSVVQTGFAGFCRFWWLVSGWFLSLGFHVLHLFGGFGGLVYVSCCYWLFVVVWVVGFEDGKSSQCINVPSSLLVNKTSRSGCLLGDCKWKSCT